jgi:hypothetical protein
MGSEVDFYCLRPPSNGFEGEAFDPMQIEVGPVADPTGRSLVSVQLCALPDMGSRRSPREVGFVGFLALLLMRALASWEDSTQGGVLGGRPMCRFPA